MEKHTMEVAVRVKIDMLYAQAVKKYNIQTPFDKIGIQFNVKGRVAGWAFPSRGSVRFNSYMLTNNFSEFMSDTVPHELAHVVARQIDITCKPHGYTWQSVMRFFGSEPSRCHSYACEPRTSRRNRVQLTCTCGHQYIITSNMYAKIVKFGARCRRCNAKLTADNYHEPKTISVSN